MKNIEKYYDDMKSEIDNWTNNDCLIRKTRDKTHLLSCGSECRDCRMKNLEWLNAEYVEPIKLTHAEKVILENVDKNYKWITRDDHLNNLYIHEQEPSKSIKNGCWFTGGSCIKFSGFNHLFQFVKWEDEPLEIAWILENCEVIEE